MEFIPAIDIRGGRSVRLVRGDFAAETVYGDPLEQAMAYASGGATRLHVVDLDAARSGEARNGAIVASILEAVSVPVEIGGGVRSLERARGLVDLGADRVVVGTAAVENPALLETLATALPGRVAVGLDHRRQERDGQVHREVAVHGWEVGSGLELSAAFERLAAVDLAAVIVTDITRDGTLAGPDLAGLRAALAMSAHPLVASGGVGSAEDLRSLRAIEESGRSLAGVVVGKALLDGGLDFEEAIAACAA